MLASRSKRIAPLVPVAPNVRPRSTFTCAASSLAAAAAAVSLAGAAIAVPLPTVKLPLPSVTLAGRGVSGGTVWAKAVEDSSSAAQPECLAVFRNARIGNSPLVAAAERGRSKGVTNLDPIGQQACAHGHSSLHLAS